MRRPWIQSSARDDAAVESEVVPLARQLRLQFAEGALDLTVTSRSSLRPFRARPPWSQSCASRPRAGPPCHRCATLDGDLGAVETGRPPAVVIAVEACKQGDGQRPRRAAGRAARRRPWKCRRSIAQVAGGFGDRWRRLRRPARPFRDRSTSIRPPLGPGRRPVREGLAAEFLQGPYIDGPLEVMTTRTATSSPPSARCRIAARSVTSNHSRASLPSMRSRNQRCFSPMQSSHEQRRGNAAAGVRRSQLRVAATTSTSSGSSPTSSRSSRNSTSSADSSGRTLPAGTAAPAVAPTARIPPRRRGSARSRRWREIRAHRSSRSYFP